MSPTLSSIKNLYCVGRNYLEHAAEFNNPIPSQPMIFTKSPVCVVPFAGEIELPARLGRCDFETEIAVMIGQDLFEVDEARALASINFVALALDLTLRDLQRDFKALRQPWDLAKNFINACPISDFVPITDVSLDSLNFRLDVNGRLAQQGTTAEMIFPIGQIIAFVSQNMPLKAGDVFLTGTPAGVGPIAHQDELSVYLGEKLLASARFKRI